MVKMCVFFRVDEAHRLTHMWAQLLSLASLHPPIIWSKSTFAESDIWAELILPAISATSKVQRQQNVQLFASIWLTWLWPEWVVWCERSLNTTQTTQSPKRWWPQAKVCSIGMMQLIVVGNGQVTLVFPHFLFSNIWKEIWATFDKNHDTRSHESYRHQDVKLRLMDVFNH